MSSTLNGESHDDNGQTLDSPTIAEPPRPPGSDTRNMGPVGRMASMGMPAEKSKDFRGSSRRLLSMMRPERNIALMGVAFALVSVTLSVIGPKVLGRGTDIIADGLRGRPGGIDFDSLRAVLIVVVCLYVVSASLGLLQSYTLAGIVQRTMFRLRSEAEEKLHRLPLNYVDGQPRGDLRAVGRQPVGAVLRARAGDPALALAGASHAGSTRAGAISASDGRAVENWASRPLACTTGIILALAGVFLSISRRPGRPA